MLFRHRDVDVLLADVTTIVEDGVGLSADGDVAQGDAVDGHLGQTIELHSASGIVTDDVADVDIAENRRLLVDGHHSLVVGDVAIGQHFGNGLSTIIHIEGDGIGLDVGHRDAVDENVLDDAATTACGLETQTDIGAEELTLAYHNIAHATAHFGAYDETAMASEDGTAVDNHVGTGNGTTAAVGVLAALDADAVVTGIEAGVEDEGVGARLEVESVAVLGVGRVAYQQFVDDDVLTHQGMEVPGGGVLEDDALQQDVLTALEAHHDGTDETLDGLPVVGVLDVGDVHVGVLVATGETLGGHPVAWAYLDAAGDGEQTLPVVVGDLLVLDGTPVLSVAVNDAVTRDADVGGTNGRERRLTTAGVEALEGGLDDGVERLVGSKLDDGAMFEMQVDVGLQDDGSRVPHATRHNEMAAAGLVKLVDGLGEGVGAEGDAVACGTKVGKHNLEVGDDGSLDG